MRQSNWQTGVLAGVIALGLGLAPRAAVAQGTCGDGDAGGCRLDCCAGDCDCNGTVTVDEVVTMVSTALGAIVEGVVSCPAADRDCSGSITVDEIVTAVNNALNGCGSAGGLTPVEECDDGGLCVGGADAGEACVSESDCDGDGACFGGLDNLRGCRSDDDCREGKCRKCRPYGGDGCAANCTIETDNEFLLVPGEVVATGDGIVFGTSGAHIFGPFLYVNLPMTGSLVVTTGKIVDGQTPVVFKATGIDLDRIPVATIACACVRGATASTCGGTLFDADGVQSPNCTPGFSGIVACPPDRKCAAVHGPGNTGSGFITCGGTDVDIGVTQDCNATPGGEPLDPVVSVEKVPAPVPLPVDKGAAYVVISSAIGTVVGACDGTTADYGPDGQFCSDDDPPSNRGVPNSIQFTSGNAQGTVLNPADFEDILGPHNTMGAPFSCDGNAIGVHGANLAGAFTSCDQPTVSDIAVVVNFAAE